MIIDGDSAGPLLENFDAAQEAEATATRALFAALKSGLKDDAQLKELIDRMTEAHDKKMDVVGQLQQHKLDE